MKQKLNIYQQNYCKNREEEEGREVSALYEKIVRVWRVESGKMKLEFEVEK